MTKLVAIAASQIVAGENTVKWWRVCEIYILYMYMYSGDPL